MEKIFLLEVRRESFPSQPARVCLDPIGDAIVEDPRLWNHHAWRRPKELVCDPLKPTNEGGNVNLISFALLSGRGFSATWCPDPSTSF